jgi:hypothetical protein
MRTKIYIALFCFCLFESSCISVPKDIHIPVTIDKRFELIGVMCYLSGYQEYSEFSFDSYKSAVDDYFKVFRNHEALEYLIYLKKEYKIAYDAPIAFAAYLSDSITPALPFKELHNGFDSRWNEETYNRFAVLINKFFVDTKFDVFFQSQKEQYKTQLESIEKKVNSSINFNWFNSFFGTPSDVRFKLSILLIGSGGYGPSTIIDNSKTAYTLLCLRPNILGKLSINNEGLNIIIHEFCHTYCNPVVYENLNMLEPTGIRIYEDFKSHKHQKSYQSWLTVQYETFVRASVLCYLDKNENVFRSRNQIDIDKHQGFYWTNQLSKSFTVLNKETTMYKSKEKYIQQSIKVYNDYLIDIE